MDQPSRLAALQATGRSLLPPLAMLAALVLVLAGVQGASGLVATVAFGALAAIISRRLQLALRRRGVGAGLAVVAAIAAAAVVVGLLAAAFIASIIALVVEVGQDAEALAEQLRGLAETFGLATGLPPDAVPPIDVGQLLTAARSLLGLVTPAVTGLLMALLIMAYLLIDADRLGGRLRGTASASTVARYDALAQELWVYVKVRAILGGGAAIADTVLLLVLGVPYAVLWGAVSFLFSFVPNIGFVLALVPPAVLAMLDGGPLVMALVIVGYIAINLAFDYVVQPRMMGDQLDLSPVVVIVSILFWTVVLGATGALLAVPLTIALRTVLLPFPGARWFVALMGPVPRARGEAAASPEGSGDSREGAADAPETTASPDPDPTIEG